MAALIQDGLSNSLSLYLSLLLTRTIFLSLTLMHHLSHSCIHTHAHTHTHTISLSPHPLLSSHLSFFCTGFHPLRNNLERHSHTLTNARTQTRTHSHKLTHNRGKRLHCKHWMGGNFNMVQLIFQVLAKQRLSRWTKTWTQRGWKSCHNKKLTLICYNGYFDLQWCFLNLSQRVVAVAQW